MSPAEPPLGHDIAATLTAVGQATPDDGDDVSSVQSAAAGAAALVGQTGAATDAAPVRRVLYCISGAWTDAWYDDPGCWSQWCCAFLGWTSPAWETFYARWQTASSSRRERLMATTGLRFFDWARVPGGSTRGSSRAAAIAIAEDLAALPDGADVTLLGHSKGGHAVKHLLAMGWGRGRPGEGGGGRVGRAVLIDAPLDWVREMACRLMGLGIAPCRLDPQASTVPCVTINNWLDPSGGRLPGVRNYQTLVWQDYLYPFPPHGMKGFLAERVLGDLGALPAGETMGIQPRGIQRQDLPHRA